MGLASSSRSGATTADDHRDRERHGRRRPHPPHHLPHRRVPVVGAIGRDPLEQPSPRHHMPHQRSRDRVEHHHALMREDDGREHRLPQARDDRVAFGAQVLAQRHAGHVAAERARQLNVGGEREHQHARASSRRRAIRAGSVQPAASSSTSAGGMRLRRRLSRIFQREITGSVLDDASQPLAPGTVRHSQRAICQSPRTQRCWRAE